MCKNKKKIKFTNQARDNLRLMQAMFVDPSDTFAVTR